MSVLARWCARRRLLVAGTWLVLLVALGGAAATVGSAFTNSTTLPDSESASAYALLGEIGGGESTTEGAGTIAWQTQGTDVDDAAVRQQVGAVLSEIDALPGVETVVSPYSEAGASQMDRSRDVAYATVQLNDDADAAKVAELARTLPSQLYEVEVGGRAFYEVPAAGGLTEVIGVLGALLVLFLMFRSAWAAVLPIVTGVAGVLVSLFAVQLISNTVDLADSTPTMGALIGLAVGIDYALFIVNRHRKALMSGKDVPSAVAEAVDTSGRAVLFAGATVVVALVGMFVVDIDILTGMARAAALTVAVTVAAAITLLPALLSMLGRKVLSRKQRAVLADREAEAEAVRFGTRSPDAPTAGEVEGRAGTAARWAALVERRPRTLASIAVLVMVVLAIPALSLRLGSSDASTDPEDTSTYRYYALMAPSFGDGFDSSLLVVAQTPDDTSRAAFADLMTSTESVEDVAKVTVVPGAADAGVSVASVQPRSTAQTEETADLVNRLRDDVIPDFEDGTDLRVYVGGTTASNIDNAEATISKLPLYLALIAVLGFLLLAIAFRSILVPLIGAVTNLLTIAVGLGALVAVFQWGWLTDLLGVGGAAPIESIVPVIVIGVMFGLSMDYQVFLVSRMHEEWSHTRRNAHAIRVGLRETAAVITTAAVIMLCVFASFGFAGQRIIAEIGIGMAVAVIADAFVMRLTIVPALMHVLGDRNWAYPKALEAITPHVSIEGPGAGPDQHADQPADTRAVGSGRAN